MTKFLGIQLLLLTALFAPAGASGQGEASPLVMRATGDIRFAPDDGRPAYRVYAGNYLKPTGQLTLADGASLELVFREKYQQLTTPGTFQIADLLGEEAPSSGLIGRFFDFISNGLDQSKSRQTLEKAYLKNQGNAQGNTRGLGAGGLADTRPFGGKLTAAAYTFTWPEYPGADHYEFSILDAETGNFLITAIAAGHKFRLHVDQLDLVDGHRYTWECRAVTSGGSGEGGSLLSRGAPKTELASISFTYTTKPFLTYFEEIGATLPGAEGTMLYDLSMAQALEENGYLYDADYLYKTLAESAGNSTLLNDLYASFLARWNLRAEAESLISN